MLGRLLQLLGSFISRSHASLASVGVAALSRTVDGCGKMMSPETWQEVSAGWVRRWDGDGKIRWQGCDVEVRINKQQTKELGAVSAK